MLYIQKQRPSSKIRSGLKHVSESTQWKIIPQDDTKGLRDYFEFIITCDEVGVGKSSPKVYEEALRRLGTQKARTLVAEDALHALQTAHAAGFPTAGIEEVHSAAQVAEKKQVSTYYISFY